MWLKVLCFFTGIIVMVSGEACSTDNICPDYLPFCTPVGCTFRCPENVFVNGTFCVEHCGDEYIYNKTCVAVCPEGFRKIEETVLFIAQKFIKMKYCLSECRSNTFDYEGLCMKSCPSKQKFINNGQCTDVCPSFKPLRLNITLSNDLLGVECLTDCEGESDTPFQYGKECVPICNEENVVFEGKCIPMCPLEAHLNLDLQLCRKAGTCQARWPNQTYCSAVCPEQYFVANNRCVQVCPETMPYLLNGTCVPSCPESFFFGNASLLTDVGFRFTLSCFSQCPKGMKANQFSAQCVEHCPKSLKTLGDTCVEDCPGNMFTEVNIFNQIYTCVNECRKYVLNHTCLEECPEIMKVFGKKCVNDCPISMFTDAGDQTKPATCVRNCSRYILKDTCVQSCPSDSKYVANGVCLERCPEHQPYANVWQHCVELCQYRSNNVTFECDYSCPVETKSYGPFCLADCPSHTYYQQELTRCVDSSPKYSYNGTCFESCPKYIFNSVCVENCPESKRFVFDSQCQEMCPNNTCLQDDGITCSTDCIYDSSSKLLTLMCPAQKPFRKQQDSKTICVSQCEEQEVLNNDTCINITECTRAILSRGRCEDSCPEGYVYNGVGSGSYISSEDTYRYKLEDYKNDPCVKTYNIVFFLSFLGVTTLGLSVSWVAFLTPAKVRNEGDDITKSKEHQKNKPPADSRGIEEILPENDDDVPLLDISQMDDVIVV